MPKRAPVRAPRASKSTAPAAFVVDDDLKAFIESGVAVLVATGDAERRPHVTYGWGPRVRDGGSAIDVFIEVARVGRTLANARTTGHMAMTVAEPVSVRSVQFKGSFIDDGAPTADDIAWVQRHRDAFQVSASLVGDAAETIRSLWMDPVTRVSFSIEHAFNQTPGPDAGRPL